MAFRDAVKVVHWPVPGSEDTKFGVTMGPGWVMERRKFTREFKLEAVRLIRERGVSCTTGLASPGRACVATAGLGEDFAEDPQHSFPGHGQMKPEQLQIAQLKREVIKLKAERDIVKSLSFFARHAGPAVRRAANYRAL